MGTANYLFVYLRAGGDALKEIYEEPNMLFDHNTTKNSTVRVGDVTAWDIARQALEGSGE
jgi:hypothetical protein